MADQTLPEGIMDVSPAVFEELKARFEACGAKRLILVNDVSKTSGSYEALNLNNVAVRTETDERVKVWLIYDGKRLNKPKEKKHGKLLPPEGTKA